MHRLQALQNMLIYAINDRCSIIQGCANPNLHVHLWLLAILQFVKRASKTDFESVPHHLYYLEVDSATKFLSGTIPSPLPLRNLRSCRLKEALNNPDLKKRDLDPHKSSIEPPRRRIQMQIQKGFAQQPTSFMTTSYSCRIC